MDDVKLALQHFRYLIIVGTTKAGTTSLHRYLCDHLQICKPRLRWIFFKKDIIRNIFRNIKTNLDSIYLRINTEQKSKDITIDDETKNFF